MEKNIAIKVENLSKAYQLGQIGTGTLSRDIERFWTTKIRGKEDPFLKIGQTNDRTIKGETDIVWSLKNINFEIVQGDAVGIIGRNGAGKSTLLKLLSRVTAPTTGSIKVKGRIASLLEVGTGFHPELSGRENIFLNGAILGMRKREIVRKFDEIIDFSGVERYIDTPVKRYSSGMYVRLAFAVAAHLESEILIVDEVLSVGDAEFQKKCFGKMGDVSNGEGRTVLFVSHNLSSISKLCKNSIHLRNGNFVGFDNTASIIQNYLNQELNYFKNEVKLFDLSLSNFCNIQNISFNFQNKNRIYIQQGIDWQLCFEVQNKSNLTISLLINVELKTLDGTAIGCFGNYFQKGEIDINSGKSKVIINLGTMVLKKGEYLVNIYIQDNEKRQIYEEDYCLLEILPSVSNNLSWNTFISEPQHGYNPILYKSISVLNEI